MRPEHRAPSDAAGRKVGRVWSGLLATLVAVALLVGTPAASAGGVSYTDIADDPASGLSYARARSATFPDFDAFRQQSLIEPLPFEAIHDMPYNTNGQPGVVVFDYDGDGDLDIYVTNGPGAPNSLFSNQLEETGAASFVDVGQAAGVDATDQDGMGACAGDIDNDGDADLMVLGRDQPNRLFENRGDGTFAEIAGSGVEGGDLGHSSCAMGDVNGDGLLDVAVANSYAHDNLLSCFVVPFDLNQHNQLYLNQGDHTFVDVSASSGIQDLLTLPAGEEGKPTITWAVAMVDVDTDGDTDIVFADDNCALFSEFNGGIDRGFLHVMRNDGAGQFTDHPVLASGNAGGNYMGVSFGDLDCDGAIDMFASNFGDYDNVNVGVPYQLGLLASRWFLGDGDAEFADPGVGSTIASVFGWGSAVFDYDNDGDQDISYYGGLDGNYLIHVDSARGVLLENQGCAAEFTVRDDVLPADPLRGPVQPLAIGDLNRDGFSDIVTVSSFDFPASTPFLLSPAQYGAPLDDDALYVAAFESTPDGFVWSGLEFEPGSLSVALNSGDNGNRWVQVDAVGSAGIVAGGRSNRDGIGATISFTPNHGQTATIPLVGGGTFSSQHSLEALFGMGKAAHGTVDVLWPGGARNRLYKVRKFERVVFPEIPCSYDADWPSLNAYLTCVDHALGQLHSAGVIGPLERLRFGLSAVFAFFDHH